MKMARWIYLWVSVIGLYSCAGGQTGSGQTEECLVVNEESLGFDEISPLGFSLAGVLSFWEQQQFQWQWREPEQTTTATLKVSYQGGTLVYQTRKLNQAKPNYDLALPNEMRPRCGPLLLAEVDLELTTEDGLLLEHWSARCEADQDTVSCLLKADVPATDLQGTLDLFERFNIDPSSTTLLLELRREGDHVYGSIHGIHVTVAGDTTSAQKINIAEVLIPANVE